MKNRDVSRPPQISLILRLLCGGYLLYLAYDLLEAIQDSPLYIAAAVVFALVSIVLLVHSVGKLWRGEYTGVNTVAEDHDSNDSEEKINEQ